MSSHATNDWMDPYEDLDFQPVIKNMPRKKNGGKPKPRTPHGKQAKKEALDRKLLALAAEKEEVFEYTYKAGELEAQWLYSSLNNFRDMKWIDDILRMVKGGKEASVYLCQAHPSTNLEYIAAKVYRPRKFRNLKNDWLYREGRQDLDENGNAITNKGLLHAIHKRTAFGKELLHSSWLEHEYKTMQMLYDASADVPKPLASSENAILMQYYGDEWMGAPTLNDVELDRSEAKVLFERMIHNIEIMLEHNRVHGDLSAFNILYWDGEIVMIDFPQAVNPEVNQSAYPIFQRDVVRVCDYFAHQGVPSQPRKLALNLWEKYHHHLTPLVNPKMLDEESEDDRSVWESLKNA